LALLRTLFASGVALLALQACRGPEVSSPESEAREGQQSTVPRVTSSTVETQVTGGTCIERNQGMRDCPGPAGWRLEVAPTADAGGGSLNPGGSGSGAVSQGATVSVRAPDGGAPRTRLIADSVQGPAIWRGRGNPVENFEVSGFVLRLRPAGAAGDVLAVVRIQSREGQACPLAAADAADPEGLATAIAAADGAEDCGMEPKLLGPGTEAMRAFQDTHRRATGPTPVVPGPDARRP
jgi:hypothetical protein